MDMVKVCKALGHEVRYEVVMTLLKGNLHSCCGELRAHEQGCCVTDLTGRFDMPQSTMSHHLSVLVDAGIVTMEKRGLWSVYIISIETIQELHETIGNWFTSSCGIPRSAQDSSI